MKKSIIACFSIIALASSGVSARAEVATATTFVSVQSNEQLLQSLLQKIYALQAQMKSLEVTQTPGTITVTTSASTVVVAGSTTTVKLPKIKVISPSKAIRINSEKGGFKARWIPRKEKVDVYLMDQDGTNRLTNLAQSVRGGGRAIKLNWEYLAETTQYRLQVCYASTTVCDVSDKPFTIFQGETPTVQQDIPSPIITSISPVGVQRTNGALVNVYGSNFIAVGKGGDLRVRLYKDKQLFKEFATTDKPGTVFTGAYTNPAGKNGTFLQVKMDTTTFIPGTYQLVVYLDGKESKKTDLVVQ
jgi:hypothetical protein